MDYVFEFLSQYSNDQIFFAYLGLLFLTVLGTLPNNSDLTIVAGTIMASLGKFDIIHIYISVIALVILGENIAYYLGYFFGDWIFKLPFYKKLMPQNKKNNLELFVNRYPLRVLLSIRLTPVFRPIWYMMLGSFKVKPKIFFKMHSCVVVCYNTVLIFTTYLLANSIDQYLKDYKIHALVFLFIIWFLVIRKLSKQFQVESKYSSQV